MHRRGNGKKCSEVHNPQHNALPNKQSFATLEKANEMEKITHR
jgi:hypothetical protein